MFFELREDPSHQRTIDIIGRCLQSFVDGIPEIGGQVVFVPREGTKDVMPWNALRSGKAIEPVIFERTRTGEQQRY
jgi:hypothetical protein